jgi:hypothetical protein
MFQYKVANLNFICLDWPCEVVHGDWFYKEIATTPFDGAVAGAHELHALLVEADSSHIDLDSALACIRGLMEYDCILQLQIGLHTHQYL